MGNSIHLIKLSAGTETVETLAQWQAQQRQIHKRDFSLHVTRMWPKREPDIVGRGSIYWVIKGLVQARQRIIRFDEMVGQDGIRRCGLVLDPELIRTKTAPRRPFQGWRYLEPEDAPDDLPLSRANEASLPKDLEIELANLGLR